MNVDFDLPDSLIATAPVHPRDHCKLLVYDRKTKTITHQTFKDIGQYINKGDLLIANQAKVSPRRVYWKVNDKEQEIIFLMLMDQTNSITTWQAIVSGKNLKYNTSYKIADEISFEIISKQEKLSVIKVNANLQEMNDFFQKHAFLPIPPYIQKQRKLQNANKDLDLDQQEYQTVFACQEGAVASPTAGLHFTQNLITSLQGKGVLWKEIFLEVGWGTFAPVTQENFEKKQLHEEKVKIELETIQAIHKARPNNKVFAVGTTVVRSLETWAREGSPVIDFEKQSNLFIYPPFSFQVVDALITNFHMPQSSLLLLVASFLGEDGDKVLKELYEEAIANEYRFYSYGDAMLIL